MQPLVSSAGAALLVCECDAGCEVRAGAAPLLGLIVSEIILNAARHAHPAGVAGRIDVGCRRAGQHLLVEVADDGVGLPEYFAAGGEGLGLEMVRVLSKQLNAIPLFATDPLGLQFLLKLSD
jgi:two-component sensor histidine kinase